MATPSFSMTRVALRFFRLQQMTEGSIDLSEGEVYPLKGPTDLGTAQVREKNVALSEPD